MAEDFLGISAHIDIEEVVTGFTAIIELLEKAGTVSEDTAKQMTAALVEMQSSLSNGVTADGLDQFTTHLGEIQNKIKETMTSFSEGNSSIDLSGMSQMVETFNQMTANALNAAQEAYQKEKDSLVQVQQAVDAAREAREKLANTGGDEFDKANDAYREACAVLFTQTQRVEELETALKSLKDAQTQINQELQAAGGITSEMCEQISAALQGAFSSFGDVPAGDLEHVNEMLGAFKVALASIDGSELSKIGPSFNALVGEIEEAVRKTSEAYANESEKARQLAWDSQRLKETLQKTVASGGASADEIAKLEKEYLATAEASYEAHDKCEQYRNTLDNLNGVLANVKDTAQDAAESVESTGSAWGKAKDAVVGWATGHGKAKDAIKQFKDGLSELPGPLGGAVSGLKKMTGAAKMFITTPIGAVLGVIVFLLKAFQTWATKSAEGQRVMAKVTAFLGSLLDSLTDILVKVGSYLYHAFADSTGPMNEFARGLVTTLKSAVMTAVNLLKGLGDVLGGIWTMFTDDWDAGWEQVKKGASSVVEAGKSALQTVESGIKTTLAAFQGAGKMISDGWKNFSLDGLVAGGAGMFDKAMKAADAAEVQNEMDENITENKKQQLKLDNDIANKEREVEHATKETLKATVAQLKALNETKYNDLVETQRKRVELLKQANSLHTPTLKSLTAQRVAELELFAIEKKREAAKRAIDKLEERQQKKLEAQEKSEKKAAETADRKAKNKAKAEARESARQARKTDKQRHDEDKAASQLGQTLEKNTQERVKDEADTVSRIEKARIDAMADGVEKRRALREYEHKKELEDIEKSAQELINKEIARQKEEFERIQAIRKAQGKSYRAWDKDGKDIDQEPLEHIKEQYQELINLQRQIQDAEDTKELVDKYKDYHDLRIENEKNFNDEISRLMEARQRAIADGNEKEAAQIARAIARAHYLGGKKQVDDAINEIKNHPDNLTAFDDLSKAPAATIKRLINDFRALAVESEKAGRPINDIKKEIEGLQKQLSVNTPFVAMIQAAHDAKGAMDAIARAQRQLNDLQNGQPIIKSVSRDALGNYTIEYKNQEDVLAELIKAKENYTEATKAAMTASIQAIGVIDNLRKSFEGLGKAIGGDVGDIFGFIGNIIGITGNGLKSVMSYADAFGKSAKTLEQLTVQHKILKDAAAAAGNATAKTGLEGELAGAKFEKAAAGAQMWIAAMTTMVQIIGAVQSLLPTSDALYEKYAKRQKEVNNLRRAVEQYRLSVLLAQQAEKGWFAKSGLTSLTDAYDKHGQVVEAYYAKLYEAQEKYQNKSAGLKKIVPYVAALAAIAGTVLTFGAGALPAIGLAVSGGIAAGSAASAIGAAVVGSVVGAVTAGAQSALDKISYKNGQVAAKDNLRMQTRHKTWFRGEKTQDLAEWTRENLNAELFDDDGLINLEAAQTILDKYGDKLVGETKETLEDLVKLREQYNEFMKEVEKYVSDLYSPLVDDMTDALFKWLETGTDVLYQFRQNAKDTFATIAKDMVKQMLLTQVFDQYKEDLKKIYAAYAATKDRDTLINGVMLATDSFLNRAETELPIIQDALAQINDKFAERGFDITGSSDEGSGAYKAAQSFSQEQGDELNGRLIAIQIGQQQGILQRSQMIELQTLSFGAVVQIGTNVLATSKDISAMRDMQYTGLQRLAEISEFTSVLPTMAENINDMRNDIRNKL